MKLTEIYQRREINSTNVAKCLKLIGSLLHYQSTCNVNYNNFKNWRFFFSQSELYKIRIKKIHFFNCIIEIFPIC